MFACSTMNRYLIIIIKLFLHFNVPIKAPHPSTFNVPVGIKCILGCTIQFPQVYFEEVRQERNVNYLWGDYSKAVVCFRFEVSKSFIKLSLWGLTLDLIHEDPYTVSYRGFLVLALAPSLSSVDKVAADNGSNLLQRLRKTVLSGLLIQLFCSTICGSLLLCPDAYESGIIRFIKATG